MTTSIGVPARRTPRCACTRRGYGDPDTASSTSSRIGFARIDFRQALPPRKFAKLGFVQRRVGPRICATTPWWRLVASLSWPRRARLAALNLDAAAPARLSTSASTRGLAVLYSAYSRLTDASSVASSCSTARSSGNELFFTHRCGPSTFPETVFADRPGLSAKLIVAAICGVFRVRRPAAHPRPIRSRCASIPGPRAGRSTSTWSPNAVGPYPNVRRRAARPTGLELIVIAAQVRHVQQAVHHQTQSSCTNTPKLVTPVITAR